MLLGLNDKDVFRAGNTQVYFSALNIFFVCGTLCGQIRHYNFDYRREQECFPKNVFVEISRCLEVFYDM